MATKIPNGLTSPNVLAMRRGRVNRRDRREGRVPRRATSTATIATSTRRRPTRRRARSATASARSSISARSRTRKTPSRAAIQGVSAKLTYHVAQRTDVGANYTLSRTWGSFDGETTASGPVTTGVLSYPEYKQLSWNSPVGDLGVDQRHRAELWANYGIPHVEGLTVSGIEHMASGVPYGAVGVTDARPFVTNPGYITPQGGSTVTYYYTARDAFRTAASYRTDLAVNYDFAVKTGTRKVDLFVQGQVLNVLNNEALCGCGATVFNNGGGVDFASTIDASVLSSANAPTGVKLAAFNPFTTAPVQGTNWQLGPNFGTALNRFAYTSPARATHHLRRPLLVSRRCGVRRAG